MFNDDVLPNELTIITKSILTFINVGTVITTDVSICHSGHELLNAMTSLQFTHLYE